MKTTVIAIVVILILLVGGYYAYHGSYKKSSTTKPPVTTTTPVVTPLPATFVANSLTINPITVRSGANISVYLKITNIGNVTGTDTVVLKINDRIVDSKDVILTGGVSTVVTFTTSGQKPGNYVVTVAGLSGNFTVLQSATPSWLFPAIAGAFIVGLILAVLLGLIRSRKV